VLQSSYVNVLQKTVAELVVHRVKRTDDCVCELLVDERDSCLQSLLDNDMVRARQRWTGTLRGGPPSRRAGSESTSARLFPQKEQERAETAADGFVGFWHESLSNQVTKSPISGSFRPILPVLWKQPPACAVLRTLPTL
jgi:hypothetical protein